MGCSEPMQCPAAHLLVEHLAQKRHSCDHCGARKLPKGTKLLRCDGCDYDLCEACSSFVPLSGGSDTTIEIRDDECDDSSVSDSDVEVRSLMAQALAWPTAWGTACTAQARPMYAWHMYHHMPSFVYHMCHHKVWPVMAYGIGYAIGYGIAYGIAYAIASGTAYGLQHGR